MTGGMLTEAVTCHFENKPIPQMCSFCNQSEVPSIFRIQWQCPVFQNLHTSAEEPPQCPKQARLGWGLVMAPKDVVLQLARIRAAECERRETKRRRPPDRRPAHGPPGGGAILRTKS